MLFLLTNIALDALLLWDAIQLHHGRVTDHFQDVGKGLGTFAAGIEGG